MLETPRCARTDDDLASGKNQFAKTNAFIAALEGTSECEAIRRRSSRRLSWHLRIVFSKQTKLPSSVIQYLFKASPRLCARTKFRTVRRIGVPQQEYVRSFFKLHIYPQGAVPYSAYKGISAKIYSRRCQRRTDPGMDLEADGACYPEPFVNPNRPPLGLTQPSCEGLKFGTIPPTPNTNLKEPINTDPPGKGKEVSQKEVE